MRIKMPLAILFLVSSISFRIQETDAIGEAGSREVSSPLSINLTTGMTVPILGSESYLSVGGPNVTLAAEYLLAAVPFLFIRGELEYVLTHSKADQLAHIFAAGAGIGLQLDPVPWITAKLFALAGYYQSILNDPSQGLLTGGDPMIAAGGGIFFRLTPSVSLGLGASYRDYMFLSREDVMDGFNIIDAFLGVSLSPKARTRLPALPKPQPLKGLGIHSIEWENVFPVFRKYYDDHPIGRIMLKNDGTLPISDISVSLFIKQYMDAPKQSKSNGELKPGESRAIELFALLTDKVLEITEATKVAVEIVLEYRLKEESQKQTVVETLRVYDRNAITWDDDRRAGAFVTAKDPQVMYFSNNVTGVVKARGAVNRSLRLAIALHEALRLYGMNYRQDPRTPYAELSAKKQEVDFLQFPSQSLEYKAGDCDDLSILYSALLESLGVETAFITIPGHIFMAFSVDMAPYEARKGFLRADELVLREGKTWIPVEVTSLDGGFLHAWELGARQWRENLSRQQANFFPVHDAWAMFEPVGFPAGGATSIDLPPREAIAAAYMDELEKFIEREITPRVTELEDRIRKHQESPEAVNALGVLYARFELWEKSEREFQKILAKEEYWPALLNLGTIFYAKDELDKALPYLEKAYKNQPKNPKILLALARVNHKLENYGVATILYRELNAVDPNLAKQYAYMNLRGEEAARAAKVSGIEGMLLWAEE